MPQAPDPVWGRVSGRHRLRVVSCEQARRGSAHGVAGERDGVSIADVPVDDGNGDGSFSNETVPAFGECIAAIECDIEHHNANDARPFR